MPSLFNFLVAARIASLYVNYASIFYFSSRIEHAPLMLAAERDIFAFDFDYRHLQSTTQLCAFYTLAKPMVDKSISDANKLGTRFRHIHDYFRPPIPEELYDVILMRT
jgi:hypothetical protein